MNIPFPESKRDPLRGLQILAMLMPFVVILVLGVAIATLVAAQSGASSSAAVRNSQDLDGCRGEFMVNLLADVNEMVAVQSEGLEALVLEDDEALAAAIEASTVLRARAREDAAAYRGAAQAAREDPAAFLETCREGDP